MQEKIEVIFILLSNDKRGHFTARPALSSKGGRQLALSKQELSDIFKKSGFDVSDAEISAFETYAALLAKWNKKINLTAITAPEEIAVKHFIDGVLILKHIDIKKDASLIDVGTGAGFPGIPLKITRPDIDVTLLDSLNKRVEFLKAVSGALNIRMKCLHLRAEDGGRGADLRERFDYSAARAVAALPVLCEYCLPFVKVGGFFLAMKGPNSETNGELSDSSQIIKLLGGKLRDIIKYSLPNGDKRLIAVIEKIKKTPPEYPRNAAGVKKAAKK